MTNLGLKTDRLFCIRCKYYKPTFNNIHECIIVNEDCRAKEAEQFRNSVSGAWPSPYEMRYPRMLNYKNHLMECCGPEASWFEPHD